MWLQAYESDVAAGSTDPKWSVAVHPNTDHFGSVLPRKRQA